MSVFELFSMEGGVKSMKHLNWSASNEGLGTSALYINRQHIRAIAQVASRFLLISVARFRSEGCPCMIRCEQSGEEVFFFSELFCFPCQYYSTATPYSLAYLLGLDNGPISVRSSM
jgi:hypothetical protein